MTTIGALAFAMSSTQALAYNRTSPITNVTIAPLGFNGLYNNTSNAIFGSGDFSNMSWDNFIGNAVIPFILTYGPFFWGGIFGILALIMYDRQENGQIPAILTIIAAVPIIWFLLPEDWMKYAGTFITLIAAAYIYQLRKKR